MSQTPSAWEEAQDDDLSIVFSAAPGPVAGAAPPQAPEPAGRPWFLPPDGHRSDDLEAAIDLDRDPSAAAAAMARIPMVRAATALLELVGEGRPLTGEGELAAADVRVLAGTLGIEPGGEEPAAMREIGQIVGAWNSLIAGGWLDVQGDEVVPGDGMVPAAAQAAHPAASVRFARALLMLLVLECLRRAPEEGGLFGGPDTVTALLHTVAPDGLRLPATVRVALDRGLVPADPAGDPDMDEINRYWQVEHDLSTLAAYGLLRREVAGDGQELRFHGTAEVLQGVLGAVEMQHELG